MKLYIKSLLLALAAVPIVLMGCLKDKDYDNGDTQSIRTTGKQKVIEIGLTSTSNVNFLLIALALTTVDTTFNLVPVILDQGPAEEDISVTLMPNTALIGSFNAAQDPVTSHAPVPSSLYTVVNPASGDGGYIVTIPKGSTTGYLKVKIKPSNYLGVDYAFAYQISKIGTPGYLISSNFSTGIVALGIKNAYEGLYHADGYFQHPSAPRAINQDVYLSTADVSIVSKTLGDLTGTNILVTITTTPVGSRFAITLAPGSGTSGTTASVAAISGDAVYNNTYDPATKTFWLKYGYPQPGPSRIITEKVTLK
jgi:hypothetical protein